jgi:2-polyprenyl-3-methyl-5-hydroxy-6-metoxy-1,4-benzoquinol methylase
MDHIEVGKYWDKNAAAWTLLARAGADVYRDYLNTPAFFEMLPDIKGLEGIDIGCGEGHNTRLLAKQGARVTGIDIAELFIDKAREWEEAEPLQIRYQVASAVALPFDNQRFDFATAFMCFMDIPETEQVLREAYRVLKPGGFLQFSISHPCYTTPHRKNLRDANGTNYAVEIGGYFAADGFIDEWIFTEAPPELLEGLSAFRIPHFNRTISEWVNTLTAAGFVIEQMAEPTPSAAQIKEMPKLQGAAVVAYFLQIRCRKPR